VPALGVKLDAKFDVLTEPWLPLLKEDGSIHMAGILEALKNAHSCKGLLGETPLETAALLRLLIAFAMDAYTCGHPELLLNIQTRRALYRQGRFDAQVIDRYIKQCLDEGVSFDLFDKKRPFMQSAYDPQYDKETKPVALIAHDLPTGHNPVHFDHRMENEHALTSAQCMSKLLAAYLFAAAGVQGYPSSVNGTPCCYIFCNGRNLFETLVLNMVSIQEMSGCEYGIPAWRNERAMVPKEQVPTVSVLEALTWPSRRVTFVASGKDGCVREVYFQQGLNFTPDGIWKDPHVAFKRNQKGEPYSLKPDTDKELWRDLSVITVSREDKFNIVPFVVRHLRAIVGSEHEQPVVDLCLYGLMTKQAKYVDWVQDSLRVSCRILNEPDLGDRLRKDMEAMETVAKIVYKAVFAMVLQKVEDPEKRAPKAKSKAKPKDKFARQVEAGFFENMRRYLFEQYLKNLSSADICDADWQNPLTDALNEQIRRAADDALTNVALRALSLSARGMEAAAKALQIATFNMNQLLKKRKEETQ